MLLLLLLMFMSRRWQASYFTVAQALPIVLPSISPYTFLWLVAKFVGKLETTLLIAQLLSANCELRNEVATFIRHELDSKLQDRRNMLFFLLMFQHYSLIPAWERKQMQFLPSIRNASVNSTCAQLPPSNCGVFARLVSLGGGAFTNFALPGGRAFTNPRAIPELLTRTRFPIRI